MPGPVLNTRNATLEKTEFSLLSPQLQDHVLKKWEADGLAKQTIVVVNLVQPLLSKTSFPDFRVLHSN